MLVFLKGIVGKKLIATILTGLFTGLLVTWNAAHGSPIPADQINAIVGGVVLLALAFLGLQTAADQSASHAATNALNIQALKESMPAQPPTGSTGTTVATTTTEAKTAEPKLPSGTDSGG
jgi:hypothetical protein